MVKASSCTCWSFPGKPFVVFFGHLLRKAECTPHETDVKGIEIRIHHFVQGFAAEEESSNLTVNSFVRRLRDLRLRARQTVDHQSSGSS